MRDRPILGMNLFSNVNQVDANTWSGSVYNPEEGKFYKDVKVTLVSSRQIVLKGCKAWLLCGEKVWTRTSAPPPVPAPSEELIEAKAPATPSDNAPEAKAPIVEAAAEPRTGSTPEAKPASAGMQATATEANAAAMQFPKVKAETTYIAPGMVTTSTGEEPLPLSGEDVSSMMVMTKPAPGATAAPAASGGGQGRPSATQGSRRGNGGARSRAGAGRGPQTKAQDAGLGRCHANGGAKRREAESEAEARRAGRAAPLVAPLGSL